MTISHVTNLVKKDSMTGICFPTETYGKRNTVGINMTVSHPFSKVDNTTYTCIHLVPYLVPLLRTFGTECKHTCQTMSKVLLPYNNILTSRTIHYVSHHI